MKATLFITWIICQILDIYYVHNVKNVRTQEDAKSSKVTIIDFVLDLANIIIGLLAIHEGGLIMYLFAAFLLFFGIIALIFDSCKYKNQKGKD